MSRKRPLLPGLSITVTKPIQYATITHEPSGIPLMMPAYPLADARRFMDVAKRVLGKVKWDMPEDQITTSMPHHAAHTRLSKCLTTVKRRGRTLYDVTPDCVSDDD